MMHPLDAHAILAVWEQGQRQHPLDRALTILAHAAPERTWDELARLSLGQRDALLLAARAQTFGVRLPCLATCPACGVRLEFTLQSEVLTAQQAAGDKADTLTVDKQTVQYRSPNSYDLAALVGCADRNAARRTLLERCVIGVDPATLGEAALTAVAQAIGAHDPLAEIALDLQCPACERRWQTYLDVAAFVWTELSREARRLMREVHTLARAYGWHESDILTMSNVRRQQYLELVA